jgi:hypothetical protein
MSENLSLQSLFGLFPTESDITLAPNPSSSLLERVTTVLRMDNYQL